jgi:hypothetical protein
MKIVKSRLAEYVMIQNPSRKCITLEYGTRRRWHLGRFAKYAALAGVSIALAWFICFGVWAS